VAKKPLRRRPNAKGRDETWQYLSIPYSMARSRAFRRLGGPALKVWIELRCRYNKRNNGDLSLSLREAAKLLGMSQSTAQRALKELEAKGFIRMQKRGQWYGRIATTWIVTDCPYDGNLPTRDWNNWRPTKRKNQSSVPKRCRGRSR